MSDALEKKNSSVPDLVRTPALEIGAEDVALPRLKLGQFMSDQVKDGAVKPGSLFLSLGSDDPDPQSLWEPGDDDGVIIHVLSMTRGKSVSEGGELVLFDYNDPDAPPDAWVTYNYVVAIPEHVDDVPAKWLLTRTGRPAAQQMNTVLARQSGIKPPHEIAFEVTTAKRENKKGEFFVPRVKHVEADSKHVEIAASLASLISANAPSAVDDAPREAEPAI